MYELIILSLLMSASVHGYLSVKVMNNIVGPYNKFSHGRLYPILAKFEEDGLITASVELAAPRATTRLRRFVPMRFALHPTPPTRTSCCRPAPPLRIFTEMIYVLEHL